MFQFFNTVKYIIGGHEYSLQDIENGVLRANQKGVGMLTRPFSKSDPRLSVALETHEPLIHFGLVCGAKSCPPIKTYTADVSNNNGKSIQRTRTGMNVSGCTAVSNIIPSPVIDSLAVSLRGTSTPACFLFQMCVELQK